MKLPWKAETRSEKVDRWTRETQPYRDRWMNWHTVFAWFPVTTKTGDVLWLERVERRYRSGSTVNRVVWDPEHRRIEA